MNDLLYRVCRRTVERGNYPADMAARLAVFYEAGRLTAAQYGELTALLSA